MAVTPEVGQVVEARREAREVADAVPVAVHEGAHVDLVDDGVAVPLRIGREAGAQPRPGSIARPSLSSSAIALAHRRHRPPVLRTPRGDDATSRRAAHGPAAGPAGQPSDRSSTSEWAVARRPGRPPAAGRPRPEGLPWRPCRGRLAQRWPELLAGQAELEVRAAARSGTGRRSRPRWAGRPCPRGAGPRDRRRWRPRSSVCHSSSRMRDPRGWRHSMSGGPCSPPGPGCPSRNQRRRRKTGWAAAQRDEAAREVEERLVDGGPVVPGELGIVAVGVVVARLRAAQLVAAEEHGHALGQEERGQQVALLPRAQGQDGGVVGGTLRRRSSRSGCATRRRGRRRRWRGCACGRS